MGVGRGVGVKGIRREIRLVYITDVKRRCQEKGFITSAAENQGETFRFVRWEDLGDLRE